MRYAEAKVRSAELLRITLGHMGRHEAAFNPLTFTLWYEYAAGINPGLHDALERLVAAQAAITDQVVERLYQAHITPGEGNALQRVGGALHKVMATIATSASQTGTRAGVFGAMLDELSSALHQDDPEALTPRIVEARVGTAQMKDSADALQQQVAAGQTEIARLRDDLDRARGEALLDPLTGVLNRKGFDMRLAELLRDASAEGGEHCLVMFDIDHFKKVNDAHGHVMGDRVLQGLGEILRHCIADRDHAAARYGGEEFAVVLSGTPLPEAQRFAEQVRERAKAMKVRHRSTQEVLFTITLSGGVAALRAGDDAPALIARADGALYQSKNSGRDRVSCG